MFQSVLREVVEQTQGAVASLLMGFDGITVDSYTTDESALNIETVGSEYSVVLAQIKEAAQMLELGPANEIAVQAETLTTIIRLLNEEYFIALTMLPSGNYGKARYLLRREAPNLLQNLT